MTDPTRHAVIVGHGPGVGDAVARAFGRNGHRVTLIARSRDKLTAAAERLSQDGLSASGITADCGDDASLRGALDEARSRFGDPDVLLYNAAHWRPGPALDVTADDLVADFRVCAAGALTAARAVVPGMRSKGRGSLLFTGGGFALYPSPAAPALSIGKASVRALALILAQELAPSGIRVGTVTIMGTVVPGTALDPDRIADAFMTLHKGAPDATTAEIRLTP